jgi:hypothetical protein
MEVLKLKLWERRRLLSQRRNPHKFFLTWHQKNLQKRCVSRHKVRHVWIRQWEKKGVNVRKPLIDSGSSYQLIRLSLNGAIVVVLFPYQRTTKNHRHRQLYYCRVRLYSLAAIGYLTLKWRTKRNQKFVYKEPQRLQICGTIGKDKKKMGKRIEYQILTPYNLWCPFPNFSFKYDALLFINRSYSSYWARYWIIPNSTLAFENILGCSTLKYNEAYWQDNKPN